jgi:hypothetical protein
MPLFVQRYLLAVGCAALAGAALHIAILFGGPEWYATFGAPQRLVEMARAGSLRPAISCILIAAGLCVLAAYAFSGAGRLRHLPLLRPVLAASAVVLTLRGALFIPLILWNPATLARICDCRSVDFFIVSTSLLCLALGIGLGLGAWSVPESRTTRDPSTNLAPNA